MERLTRRIDGSLVFPSELVGVTMTPDNEYIYALLQRLAAYEDTELEPEEIKSLQAEYAVNLNALESYRSIGSVDRLRELAQADREGRCVVLPDGGYEDKDGENALKSAMHTCFYHNNPVTRFIADAVAEKLVRNETKMKHCEGMAKNG